MKKKHCQFKPSKVKRNECKEMEKKSEIGCKMWMKTL
jgi:hypothetical protein